MHLEFSGSIWFWKGPAPWYFVTVPDEESDDLEATVATVSYGWGMIPVTARVGDTEWDTALWPKDDHYIEPLKADVRQAESLREGDTVTVKLEVSI